MLSLKWNASKEKLPEHGQNIIFLKKYPDFGFEGYGISEATVEYMTCDEDFTFCGYEEGYELKYNERLLINIDGKDALEENIWWIDEEEYWKQFDEAERNLKCIV